MRRLIPLLTLLLSFTAIAEAKEFKSLAELETASREDYQKTRRFKLTAQVIAIHDKNITLSDGTFGNTFRNLQYHPKPFRIGDVVRVKGSLEAGRGSWLFHNIRVLSVVEHQPLPPILELHGSEINDAANRHRLVRMRGVLTSAIPDDTDPRYIWLTLGTASGPFMTVATTNTHSYAELNQLIDAEMEVTGISTPFTGWRQNLGQYISTENDQAIRVVIPPPADPFDVPKLERSPSPHRRRTIGRVIAVGNTRFYLKTAEHPLLEIIPNDDTTARPQAGDIVEVVGFMRKSPFNPILADALTRKSPDVGIAPADTNLLINPTPTIDNSSTRANTCLNGRMVLLTGSLERMNYDPDNGFSLNVNDVEFKVETHYIDTSKLSLQPGCQLEVTGLCTLQFDAPYSQAEFPHFNRFVLTPRTIDDLKVISHPPWWTPLRLFILMIVMAIIIIGILVWNLSLRILSERRARALTRERIARTKTEVKIEERTRLAVELHDSLSQMLTGVAMQLDSAARAEQEGKGSTGRFLETAKQMLGSCRKELQACLWDLRSRTFAEKDLTEAIHRTLAPHTDGIQLDVRFNVPSKDLSESVSHTILAIVRELCVNAIRHGNARHLRVAGEFHDETVSFSVRDDGSGFDPEHVVGPKDGHFGLHGIRERLSAYDGELTINSFPNHGTKITVFMNSCQRSDARHVE